jgi:hypothetical protein
MYVDTDNLTGYYGSFFFGGNTALQSGYDYVGYQVGNSEDKWQMVAIDSLKWRQNDSGGADSTHWTDWKVLLDSVNFSTYARPKNRVQQTGINAGWYQVATVNTYSSLLLSVGGGWNNAACTLATFYITHHHTTDYITQLGTSYLGFVTKVRLRRISDGYIGIDVYVSRNTTSIICAEVMSLDSRPTIVMTQFEEPGEGTSVAEVDIVGRSNFGYLPLSGGTLTGNLIFNNNCWIYCKTTDNEESIALGVNTSDQFFVGFGPAGKGCNTYVDGNNLYLRYGTSRTAGILLDSSGNVGVGTTSPSYKLHVNGSAKVNDLWIGDIHITYDSTNGGLYIGGGLAASTYVSALGTNAGGGGVTLNEPLSSINNAGLGTPTTNGVTLVWNNNSRTWTYGTTSIGSVTSVGMSVPTGFRVSSGSSQTITSSGTFALTFASGYSLPTTAKQTNWDAAYSASHSHDNMSVLNGITATKVSNWDTAYADHHTHANKSVLDGITATKVSNWDTAYGWGNHATAGYATPSSVATQMQSYSYISSGVIHIGDSSITPITDHQTVNGTFWGVAWSNGGTVNGDMTGVGNIDFNASGKNIGGLLYFNTTSGQLRVASNATVSTFTHASTTVTPNLYVAGEIGTSAGLWAGFAELYYSTPYIDFHFGSNTGDYTTRIIEAASGVLTISAFTGTTGLKVGSVNGDYLQVGNVRMVYDSGNTALKVVSSDGTSAANLYAVGGVSALGFSQTSDIRSKAMVRSFRLGVEDIAGAPLFTFRWKADGERGKLLAGSSAQYWRGVLPEVVTEDADGMLGMDYGVTALASVISVAARVQTHEERIKALEAENEKLRKEIEILKG